MRRSAYGNILEISSFAGKILLENGAEIFRVEQTARHICRVYGLGHCECFATPTAIMVSVIGKNGEVHSVVRRITKRSVNLRKVALVNEFSRDIAGRSASFEQVKAELQQIDELPVNPLWFMVLTAAAGTAAFTVVFGGGRPEFLYGFFTGGLVHLLTAAITSRSSGPFLPNLAGGAGCALFARLLVSLGGGDRWIITISALMLLVPGMLMTNAFRDLAAGDFLSGLSRAAEALCIAVSLAGGAALVIFLLHWGGL